MRYLQAESGFGYALGIVGVSLMLALLLYPLRKRLAVMESWLDVGTWFRWHMVLGVLGPVCILLHSNFRLGSTNSNVALFAMLLVSGSGLVGRYLYGKVHFGLYGKQIELKQIREDLESLHLASASGSSNLGDADELHSLYLDCSKIVASQEHGVSYWTLFQQRRWLRKRYRIFKRKQLPNRELREYYRTLAGLLDRLAGLRLFESLFNLWHTVHIPVFLLMIVTVVVHVFAVHWY